MVETIGTEGQMVRQELEKLVLYCADKQLITLEDVVAVLCGAEQYTHISDGRGYCVRRYCRAQ